MSAEASEREPPGGWMCPAGLESDLESIEEQKALCLFWIILLPDTGI